MIALYGIILIFKTTAPEHFSVNVWGYIVPCFTCFSSYSSWRHHICILHLFIFLSTKPDELLCCFKEAGWRDDVLWVPRPVFKQKQQLSNSFSLWTTILWPSWVALLSDARVTGIHNLIHSF